MNRNINSANGKSRLNAANRDAARRQHHKKRKRRRNRSGILIPALFTLIICLLAMVPVVRAISRARESAPAAVFTADLRAPESQNGAQPQAPIPTQAAEAPQVTFEPQRTEAPTPEPTASPTPTPEPTATPTPEPTAFTYLPVTHQANTDAKKIAITVDDCYQVNNLKTIVSAAEKSGAKLTLFPVGENLSKTGMPELLKRCAFDLGFEIENHTWSHARIFRLSDQEMAEEIWKQDAALDQALGVNYQAHFLRLMGGDGDTDPRIHSYIRQLGYLGLANWSVSGSDSELSRIKASLAPGQVYLFHCTDPDTKKLKEFIPWAVSQGYKLVTLNELFGLPANEVSALTAAEMPAPLPDVDDGHTLKEGEYTWVAVQLQDKLRALGYLVIDGPSTGYYGPQTVKAVKRFQSDHGLAPTGETDAATREAIMGA